MNIIFAGTPEFAANSLEAIIKQGHQVVAVYTQPDRRAGRGKKILKSPVKLVAEAHDLPVYQPEKLTDQEAQKELDALKLAKINKIKAQEKNIAVVTNNIANVNTMGFKKDRAEFQDLMYQSLNYTAGATSSTTINPTGIDVGMGVRTSGIQKSFLEGDLKETGNTFDIAIEGEGFFKITMPDVKTPSVGVHVINPDSEILIPSGAPDNE